MRRIAGMIIILFSAASLSADLEIVLTPPVLGPGMASLQTLLDANALDFTDDIEALLSGSLSKPLFMEAFSRASWVASVVPGSLQSSPRPALSVGSLASVYSTSFGPEILDRLGAIGLNDDLSAGGALEPLVARVSFPLAFISKNLDAGAVLGFMDASAWTYGVNSFSAGVFAGWTFGEPSDGPFSWDGLRLELGGGYAANRLEMTVLPGPITQTIPIDLDGPLGPLAPLQATLSIDPTIDAGVETRVYTAQLQATSGITLLRAISICAGGGVNAVDGYSGISIDADAPIVIRGYLANLVDQAGSIAISGTTGEQSFRRIGGYLCGGLRFAVGSFSLGIPFVWNLDGGFGTGAFIGLRW